MGSRASSLLVALPAASLGVWPRPAPSSNVVSEEGTVVAGTFNSGGEGGLQTLRRCWQKLLIIFLEKCTEHTKFLPS